MEFEEVRYGMLMMVLCDREGRVYDVWITFESLDLETAKECFRILDLLIKEGETMGR